MDIKIGSTIYNLIKSKEVFYHPDCDELLGEINGDDGTITITDNYPIQTKKQVLWHEIVHGILNELGMEKLDDDEAFVDAMAKMIYGFHQDNNIKKIYKSLEE